jgi:hypothetical protein
MSTAFASDAVERESGPRGDDRDARHISRGLHLQPLPQLAWNPPAGDKTPPFSHQGWSYDMLDIA